MIDDITYNNFVMNMLSQAKMREVEHELLKSGDADSVIVASIVNSRVDSDLTNDMIGEDTEIFSNNDDRNNVEMVSKEENKQNTNIMNANITKEEFKVISALVEKFNASEDKTMSLQENMKRFFMENRLGALPEEADELVSKIGKGVETFNERFQSALKEDGIDCRVELEKITEGMALEEKYNLYINFLGAISSMEASNLSKDNLEPIQSFEELKQQYVATTPVSEVMVEEILTKISEVLDNNSLCIGTASSIKELLKDLPKGEGAIETTVTGSIEDIKKKNIASLATYIAYRNDELPSLSNQSVTAEDIAVSVSAAIEQNNVMSDLASGKTTIDYAIKILKVIGAVALISLMFFLALRIFAASTGVFLAIGLNVFGFSSVGKIISLIGALAASLWINNKVVGVGESIYELYSHYFDVLVDVCRTRIWPSLCETISNVIEWFRNLKNNGAVTTQSTEQTIQENPIIA